MRVWGTQSVSRWYNTGCICFCDQLQKYSIKVQVNGLLGQPNFQNQDLKCYKAACPQFLIYRLEIYMYEKGKMPLMGLLPQVLTLPSLISHAKINMFMYFGISVFLMDQHALSLRTCFSIQCFVMDIVHIFTRFNQTFKSMWVSKVWEGPRGPQVGQQRPQSTLQGTLEGRVAQMPF